jgi:hypothetical protein
MSVEEPTFRVRLREGRFEVRDYPSLVIAEVIVAGDQKQAANTGFRILAGYIFGGNARAESIAMTAPVTLFPTADNMEMATTIAQAFDGRQWVVRFNIPKPYTISTLPKPKDTRIRLRVAPAARVAVIQFSGLAQPDDVKARANDLTAWLEAHRLHIAGAASLAQYDPPWTLWFLRRNEVSIPVAA